MSKQSRITIPYESKNRLLTLSWYTFCTIKPIIHCTDNLLKCVDLEAKKDLFYFFHNNVPNVSRVHFRFIIMRCLFHFLYKTATRLDLSSLELLTIGEKKY